MYGNAADHPDRVRRYPSDMTDAEWAAIRPLLPVPAWLQGRG
ncbi:transposase, partial [Streptomyces scopuliridis]